MIREDGLRHDMHPPAEMRVGPDRESYNARLAAEFDDDSVNSFDAEAFFEELEAEDEIASENAHVQESQYQADGGAFDEDEFLSELEVQEDGQSAEIENTSEAKGFDEDEFLDDLEQQEADQDHWDDFDYSSYVSAADEAEAKATAEDERQETEHSHPLPGDRSLSEEFNQVDDDFDWRSYESAADEIAAKREETSYDEEEFLDTLEQEADRADANQHGSDFDQEHDM